MNKEEVLDYLNGLVPDGNWKWLGKNLLLYFGNHNFIKIYCL